MPELEVGWYPVEASPYDEGYWARYVELDKTPAADALTRARCDLAQRWAPNAPLVDVGIGGGRFVRDFGAFGYDINPVAVDWLKAQGRWFDPTSSQIACATFWDSLEHIPDPRAILANIRDAVFVSMPIYDGPEHVLRSKHFRKDEHCWYFTANGFVRFMASFGFECAEMSTVEQPIREDIVTFAFVRERGAAPDFRA